MNTKTLRFLARPGFARRLRVGALTTLAIAAAAALPAGGAGQDGRPQDLDLGAAGASAEPGAEGLGRRHREGVGRHHQGDAVPVRAARQGVRPLRHGARRHRRLHLRQSRATSPAASRSSPSAQLPFIFANAKGGTAALDAWYRKYAAKEMKDMHFCFAFIHDPGTFHGTKKIVLPERHQGHEGPARRRARSARWSRCWAAPTCRPRRPRRATCSSAASPTRSPSRGARSSCSASTRW